MLNPFFAAITFSALLYTIHLQHKAIDQTNAELKLALEQSTRAADAHVEAQKVMSEQLKTQALQQFDSVFFSLLDKMTDQIDKLTKGEGGIGFNKLYFDILTLNKEKGRSHILSDRDLSNFFIFLYQILKNIDSKLFDEKLKKDYSNIVRSLLPDQILQLLVINCYLYTEDHQFDSYKKLVTKFSLFEHITFPQDIESCANFLNTVAQYDAKAFGENPDYMKFKKSIFFNDLKGSNEIFMLIFNYILNSKIKFKYKTNSRQLKIPFSGGITIREFSIIEYQTSISSCNKKLEIILYFLNENNKNQGILINGNQIYFLNIFEYQLQLWGKNGEIYYLKFKLNKFGDIVIT